MSNEETTQEPEEFPTDPVTSPSTTTSYGDDEEETQEDEQ